MIAKILSSTGTFAAVRYNTDKMDRQKGELIGIRNFGLLDNDFALRPEEVRNYLKAVSALNKNVKKPQFHATISCKGREYSKEELGEIAVKWMEGMGYGKNPYIVVFHSDTRNNHVHIVSTRVGMDGKKINDSFERLRAIRHVESIMKKDSGRDLDNEIKTIADYSISSVAQLRLLFETANFETEEKDGTLCIYKGGQRVRKFHSNDLDAMIRSTRGDEKRIAQIRAIIKKYRDKLDATLVPEYRLLKGGRTGEITGYRSDVSDFLKKKIGLQFVFHFREGKPPYGYTVIDRKETIVYKGSQLMKLAEWAKIGDPVRQLQHGNDVTSLVEKYNHDRNEHREVLSFHYGIPSYKIEGNGRKLNHDQRIFYRDLLRFYLDKNPIQALENLNIVPIQHQGKWYLIDKAAMNILDAREVLSPRHYSSLTEESGHLHRDIDCNPAPGIGWSIDHDEDDEKVYGKERNRDARKKR